jgi:hypothetical protein
MLKCQSQNISRFSVYSPLGCYSASVVQKSHFAIRKFSESDLSAPVELLIPQENMRQNDRSPRQWGTLSENREDCAAATKFQSRLYVELRQSKPPVLIFPLIYQYSHHLS